MLLVIKEAISREFVIFTIYFTLKLQHVPLILHLHCLDHVIYFNLTSKSRVINISMKCQLETAFLSYSMRSRGARCSISQFSTVK